MVARKHTNILQRCKTRLKSQTGASLPLALMVFLICSLLTSVMLVAATITTGQNNTQNASTQHYYSVSSTARMFADLLDNQTVEITLSKEYEQTETTQYSDGAVASKTTTEGDPTYSITVDGEDLDSLSESDITILEKAAIDYAGISLTSTLPEELWENDFAILKDEQQTNLNVTHDITSAPSGYQAKAIEDGLEVNVKQYLNPDGNITFVFESPANSTGDVYSVALELDADISIDGQTTETSPVIEQNTTQRVERQTITDSKVFSITWHVVNLSRSAS